VVASQEFNELSARLALSIGCAVLASIAAVGVYMSVTAAPACNSTRTLDRVAGTLRDHFHLDGIFLNDPMTVSGGWFSDSRDCWAEIAAIRGNENASALPWRAVRYRIVHQANSQAPTIDVQLGGDVPLAPPTPSVWKRLLAYL
jgi:hypothetical protein